MPVQSFATAPSFADAPSRGARPPTRPRGLAGRRFLVIGGAVALAAFATFKMNQVLNGSGVTALGAVVVLLFVSLFAWIALAFTSAVAGFVSMLAGGGHALGTAGRGPLPTPTARTALLLPTYNEEPARVTAGLQAVIEDLVAAGRFALFDVFILSDTTDPDIWVAEEAAFLRLREDLGTAGRQLFYRRRPKNVERKAGNVAEWVRRFGAAYPFFITLDADSLMTADLLVRLVASIEAHPAVGLVQTLPVIVNGTTFFSRAQQFAGRIYGPLVAHGIASWHGSEGNYWGHNAVIRTRAFADAAGLPHLSGRKPFGGHVLSHDFVEAALLRRAGWAVHMLPALAGSYEESPPSLTDIAIRDRRWAQGNLQHAKILPARGLHWVSRLHMLMGIGSYATSPLWLVFLLAGILISLQSRFVRPAYFGTTRRLFPDWPHVDPVLAKWVFVGTLFVLLAPKLLAFVATLADRPTRQGAGGAVRLFLSVVVETVTAGLIAPIAMLLQTGAVLSILLGRDSGWNAQRRDDGTVPLRTIWRAYRLHTVFGLLLAAAAYAVSLPLTLWMLPVLIGLIFAVPLVSLTGSRAAGLALRRAGLLLIPEERTPPSVLTRAASLLRPAAPVAALDRLAADPRLLAAHRAMLSGEPDPLNPDLLTALAKLDGRDLATLTRGERLAILSHPRALDRLADLQGSALDPLEPRPQTPSV